MCPEMGPLDHFDKKGDISWAGGANYDGYSPEKVETKVDSSLIVDSGKSESYLNGMKPTPAGVAGAGGSSKKEEVAEK